MNFTQRPATPLDLAFLFELRRLTMDEYLRQDGLSTAPEEHLKRIEYCFEDAKIIEFNQQPIGLFKLKYHADDNQWVVIQIQIHPDFQNKKIATRLLSSLMEKAGQSHGSIALSVLKSNPAIKLYNTLGFKQVAESDAEYHLLYET
ncbi:GNAT family N-acetyltransferase [Aliiglaciecola sp. LCG003]|uniref:GNAT family N-acetyltransferase n=1 Tax=Aliiglaciecola sp. LCG003 TaxID=3053655 RepID=UPI00257359A6|nr:GNAT family N-acetyltransferase [Aliiglaciecola sp. LCG003]WJG10993.1 GNAT family N-acetyltransferase [Aliiglaciecola sp. LCG003]